MNNAKQKEIQINCFVSDSAGEYAAARQVLYIKYIYLKFKNYLFIILNFNLYRRQLRVEYPNKVFIPCMAHQINLIVEDIFKESESYKITSKNAVRIVSYFHSSSYFMGLLRNEQKLYYNQTISLATLNETYWNSFYFCFNSILKTEAALKVSIIAFIKYIYI